MDEHLFKIIVENAVNKAMDEETKNNIRKIQSDLIRIDNGERFFFNITNYKNLGLIKERDIMGKDSTGNKVIIRTEYYLTDKAKQYIKVAV
jgi:hypothetical protein